MVRKIVVIGLFALVTGCSESRFILKSVKSQDITSLKGKRIAVIPEYSATPEYKNAFLINDFMARAFQVELMQKGYSVVERTLIPPLFSFQNHDTEIANAQTQPQVILHNVKSKELAAMFGADILLFITVTTDQTGSRILFLTARLIDPETGNVILGTNLYNKPLGQSYLQIEVIARTVSDQIDEIVKGKVNHIEKRRILKQSQPYFEKENLPVLK